MSPRAAWRLESLGFGDVSDYEGGKLDWLAFGLPVEGRLAAEPRLATIARPDVPTCRAGERVADVASRVLASQFDVAVVVNEHGVVEGLLGRRALASGGTSPVEEVMTLGPSTYRPHVTLHEMANHLQGRQLETIVVTRSDGTLIGAARREDVPTIQPAKD